MASNTQLKNALKQYKVKPHNMLNPCDVKNWLFLVAFNAGDPLIAGITHSK